MQHQEKSTEQQPVGSSIHETGDPRDKNPVIHRRRSADDEEIRPGRNFGLKALPPTSLNHQQPEVQR